MRLEIPVQKRSSNEFYAALAPELQQQLQSSAELKTVPGGTVVVEHGRPLDSLVVLEEGKVEVSVPGTRKSISLGMAQSGKVFGMRALLAGELAEVNVTCLDTCRISLLPRDVFLKVLRDNPRVYFAVAKVLSADLKIADRLIRNYSRRCSPSARNRALKTAEKKM